MSGTIATGRLASERQTTKVCSWALPPYASHHARWKAYVLNGVAHGVAAASLSQASRGIDVIGRCSTWRSDRSDGTVEPVGVGPDGAPGHAGSRSRAGLVIAARI